ncbi:TSUP family transporter [Pseudomonas sp. G.S.17]|uniref:TSUP family transporter n=1 Tax=Pseudomonas sp. G.S.17 TaxID=3137451 RepID=UPI00311CADD3
MIEIDITILLSLAAVAFLAGFFDAIAGGGGLITLPALFMAGIDPVAAIATNKFQAASATLSATVAFARKGLIEWRRGAPMAVMSFLGGALGALSISYLPKMALEFIVPILLIIVATYFALAPKLDDVQRKARVSILVFTVIIAPLIGFYDGVFGPGVGSFFMVAFVMLMGQGILRAMSNSKFLNASCNLGALTVFAWKGAIILPIALTMAAAAFVGAQLGARCAVRFGAHLIRPMLITVCFIMAVKLVMADENPLGALILSTLRF